MRILVVDDSRDIRVMAERRLSKRGHVVSLAVSGNEALELLVNETPDVILLDQMMPKMDGLETLERIREIEPDLPVIMFTAHSNMTLAVEFMRLGQDYVEKPIDFDILEFKLQRAAKLGVALRERHLAEQLLQEAEVKARVAVEIQEDLELARSMQDSLLTKASTVEDVFASIGYRVAIFNQSPATISGDFFRAKKINNRSVGLFFADTCGHGMSAALISIRILGILDQLRSPSSHASDFLEMLNDDISDLMPYSRFIAGSYLILNNRGNYCIANAAQPYPLLVQDGRATFLEVGGNPLGQFSELQLVDFSGQLKERDRLILHTDGLIEASNAAGEQYGEERLRLLVQKNADLSLVDLCAAIVEHLKCFMGNQSLDDDLTIVVLEKSKEGGVE